jgi:hypothetical protein
MDGHLDPRVALQDMEKRKIAIPEGPFEDVREISYGLVVMDGHQEIQAIGHGRLLLL